VDTHFCHFWLFKKRSEITRARFSTRGPNVELVETTCTACHSARLVLQNRMSRERWDETLTWMQKKHNLPEFDTEDRMAILDYLSTHLAPEVYHSMDGLPPRRVNVLPSSYTY
jgi:cytochrome c1